MSNSVSEEVSKQELILERLPYPHTVHKLFRIPLQLSDKISTALLDTGSVASFISTDIFYELSPKKIQDTKNESLVPHFRCAAGQVMEPVGYYSVPLTIEKKVHTRHPFYIVPTLQEGCILGMDFINQHKARIDADDETLSIVTNDKRHTVSLKQNGDTLNAIKEDGTDPFALPHLSDEERPVIRDVLEKYAYLFAEDDLTALGKTSVFEHEIVLKPDSEPFVLRPYRTAINKRPFLQQHIKDMLRHNIIRPSKSPYRSPIVLAEKKDGKPRFCVDYRRLNKQTRKDPYPIPRIDETLDSFYGCQYFTTLDLFSGYWQVEIREEDKYKTAFNTMYGHYEFNRMPFGLCNAPSTFQRLMDTVLEEVLRKFALVYIDDLIIYSKTIEEHAFHLTCVFDKLEAAGLKIKRPKCLFAQQSVAYLGHIVSSLGNAPDDKKIKAVKEFPVPTNVDKVRSFVGLASYYRRFIPNFADKAHALTRLTRKNVAWQWGAAEQSAFDCIKECLTTTPVLGFPDFSRAFIIQTDACGYGIGAVLSQMQSMPPNPGSTEEPNIGSEAEVVIAYTSKHLNDTQSKWSTTEKEAYAIVHAIKTFHHYISGTNFTIVTDHRPLEYIMSKKEPTGRLARWALLLQSYDMTITYRPGKNNQNADCLSRAPVNVITFMPFKVDDWVEAQKSDAFCKAVLDDITNTTGPKTEHATRQLRNFQTIDNFKQLPNQLLITSRGQTIVPETFRNEIMERFHSHKLAGHFGLQKTLTSIQAKYFWPSMTTHIKTYVMNCLTCARRKAHKTCKAPLQPIPVSDYLWERVAMDIVGPVPTSYKGNSYILVIMEYVSRYVIATPMRDMTANTVMRKFIKHVVLKEGIPAQILTDLGSNFQSESMEALYKQLGIKQLRTTAYHPQTDGAVEKFNKTLGDMLTAHVHQNPQNWDTHLDYCVACYNQTTHISTKETPFFLLKGRDPLEPTDLRPPMRYRGLEDESNIFTQQWSDAIDLAKAHLIIAQNQQKQNYDKAIRPCVFEVGDQVLLKESKSQTGKFYMRWDGPFRIVDKLSSLNYLIRAENSNTTQTVHVNRLRKWTGRDENKSPTSVKKPTKPTRKGVHVPNTANRQPLQERTTNEKPFPTDRQKENQNTETQITEEPIIAKRRRGRPRKVAPPPPLSENTKTMNTHLTPRYSLRKQTRKPEW